MKLWKIRKFAGDVVYDLRSRNLLSVAILLVVAILAVPFLISRGGSEPAPPPAPIAQSAGELAPEGQSAVVEYDPGLRDYKKRLSALTAKDPFKQQFSDAGAAVASTLDTAAVETVSGDESGSVEVPSTDTGGGGGGSTKTKTKGKTKTKYSFYETDVSTGEAGAVLTRQNKIKQFDFLPSATVPVLVFLGVSSGGSQAIFLVAKDVSGVGGDGTCFPNADACQLLGLDAGKGADLIYTVDGKTYHVQVDRIKRVVSSKPPQG